MLVFAVEGLDAGWIPVLAGARRGWSDAGDDKLGELGVLSVDQIGQLG